VMAGVTEAVGESKDLQVRTPSRGTRTPRTGQPNRMEGRRFFLSKHSETSAVPELGREFPGEPEAIVESLKTGLSYFVVSEWRGVADFSGRKPQLSREAVAQCAKNGVAGI